MSTYLDLPLSASLVALWFCYAYLPDWTYNSDAKLGWYLRFFESYDLFELPSFFLKVFLKLLSSARPFFTLYSYFRQENIYLIQCAMQYWLCMNETSEHLNSFFIWICFIPLFRIYCFTALLCPCAFYRVALLTCYASVLFLERHSSS